MTITTNFNTMKKMIVIFAILLFSARLTAPAEKFLVIEQAEVINYYDQLIKAVVMVESANGKYTCNSQEQAVGWFQIREVRVIEYNQLTGSNYKLEDFYDFELSRAMFLYYCKGRDYESVARAWNGKWSLTEGYWMKILKQLNNH